MCLTLVITERSRSLEFRLLGRNNIMAKTVFGAILFANGRCFHQLQHYRGRGELHVPRQKERGFFVRRR